MDQSLVSIVIPTFNRAETIKDTILNVLNQSYTNIEVIVVDDGSADDTEKIVRAIDDNRIVYIKNIKNIGANASRNKGIRSARGSYIAFIDSADKWEQSKIEKQLHFLQENKENTDIVFCAEQVNMLSQSFLIPFDRDKRLIREGKIDVVFSSGENCVDTSTIFCKKECFQIAGDFDELLPRCQEYEWLIRAVQKCKISYMDECLVQANIRADSISSDINKLLDAMPQIYNKNYDYFIRYERKIDILMVPIKELRRMQKPYSYFKKYFEFMDKYIEHKQSIIDLYGDVLSIMFSENLNQKYRIRNMKDGYDLRTLLKRRIKFNIFGAGEMAKEIYFNLKEKGLDELIEAIIVTSLEGNHKLDKKKQLLEARKCNENVKKIPILLAVNEFNLLGAIELLEQLDFKRIITFSTEDWKVCEDIEL